MGTPLIPGIVGESVQVETIHSARPAHGRTMATFAQQEAALAGYRGMRWVASHTELANNSNDGIGAGTLRTTWYAPMLLGPIGTQLWIGLWLYAEEASSAATACTSRRNGRTDRYLPEQPALSGHQPGKGAGHSRDIFVHVPWLESTGSRPRLLNVSAERGKVVIMKFVTTNVRIYTIMGLQAYKSRTG